MLPEERTADAVDVVRRRPALAGRFLPKLQTNKIPIVSSCNADHQHLRGTYAFGGRETTILDLL